MCIPFESKSADTVPPKPVSFVLTTPLQTHKHTAVYLASHAQPRHNDLQG